MTAATQKLAREAFRSVIQQLVKPDRRERHWLVLRRPACFRRMLEN